MEAVQSFRQEEKAAGNPRDELKLYLESGPEVTSNVVGWWGHQCLRYPTLRRIARDYLAIQGSATPSEHAFSSGGIMDTACRNRLSPKLFEALQLLKSAYRNGHITALHQALQHDIDHFGVYQFDDHNVGLGALYYCRSFSALCHGYFIGLSLACRRISYSVSF